MQDIYDVDNIKENVELVFCACKYGKRRNFKIEEMYAKAEIVVVSNNSANRWTKDVPMLMPEINYAHLDAIEAQKQRLNSKGLYHG